MPIVGGKTASLGEMFRELTPKGIEVPDGFAITAAGYWHVLRETRLDQFIGAQLLHLDANDIKELQKRGASIRDAILAAKLPTDLRREVLERLRSVMPGLRRAHFRCSPKQRDGGRFARGQFRRRPGNLPECDRPRSRD